MTGKKIFTRVAALLIAVTMVVPMLTSCHGTKQTKSANNTSSVTDSEDVNSEDSAVSGSASSAANSTSSKNEAAASNVTKIDLSHVQAASGTPSAAKPKDLVDTSKLVIYPPTDPVMIETPKNFGGNKIYFATEWPTEYAQNSKTCGAGNGYAAMQSVQKDYNCKIVIKTLSGDFIKTLQRAVTAKQRYADIYDTQGMMATTISNGYFQDLRKIKSINLAKNGWNEASTEGTSYKGGIYGVCINQRMFNRICMFYNKSIASKYGLGDMYSLVYNYKWNLDNFGKLCQAVSDRSGGKVKGFGALGYDWMPYLMIQNNSPMLIAKGGKVYFNGTSDGSLAVLNFIQGLYKNNLIDSANAASTKATGDPTADFEKGKSLFYLTADYFRESFVTDKMQDQYGLLPLPLGFNGQKDYYSVVQCVRYYSIDKTEQDYEGAGSILTALSKRAYIKIADWDKYCAQFLCDSESVNMLNLIMKSKPKFTPQFGDNTIYKVADNIKNAEMNIFSQKQTAKQAMSAVAASAQKDINSIYNS